MTTNRIIELLGEIRAEYNFFDENEREKYEVLSKAIREVREEQVQEAFEKDKKEILAAQPEIVRCKDCIHRPRFASETEDAGSGYNIVFPDGKCPCQCDDEYYNWMPYDDWFCGNGERRTDDN